MPSSSSSSGFSGRGVISWWLKASVATSTPFVRTGASIARAVSERCSLESDETKEGEMAFEVPPLPYDYAALEPHIDEQTMRVHHDKHHQAYVDNANKALDGTEWADRPVEVVLTELEVVPEDKRAAVRNNVGGHANHSFFWEIMSPNAGGSPEGELASAIDDTFGGLDSLKELVNDTGVKRFGSGWTWLVWDGTGLAVYSTAN